VVTRPVPLVEKELLTLWEQHSLLPPGATSRGATEWRRNSHAYPLGATEFYGFWYIHDFHVWEGPGWLSELGSWIT